MLRLLGAALLVIMLMGLVNCSSETEQDPRRKDAESRREARPKDEPVARGPGGEESTHPEGPAAREGTTEAVGTRAPLDYVVLGDSLAVGVGARRGYADRYADYLAADTGARVRVTNLGLSGQTSTQLLEALRDDDSVRRKLREAEVVTFNIGLNDLGRAGEAYEDGTCGGMDGTECLGRAVERVKGNWDAIVAEILRLRSTDDAIIRTAGLGYTPRVDEVFEPYLDQVSRHIAETAAENGMPHAQAYLADGYMSPDGIHPNDDGYEVIAERLRELGYEPLSPRKRALGG